MTHWKRQENTGANHKNVMQLSEHVLELRSILLNTFVWFLVIAVFCSFYVNDIIHLLLKPITNLFRNRNVIYTSITEPLYAEFKVILYTSLFLVFPVLFVNLWRFIKHGLMEYEKSIIKSIVVCAFTLFVIGAVFAWYIVIPNITIMLKSTDIAKQAVFLPSIAANVQFVITTTLMFGVSFQIPVIMILLDKIHIVSIKRQIKLRREYALLVTIIAAVITPPDIMSMLFIMIPMLLLYFGTIAFYKIIKHNLFQ